MKLSFLSLANGSSGNCYYLGTEEYGILIDAGISLRRIKKILKEKSLDFDRILGVLITHDHADHINSVASLAMKCKLPIYATAMVHRGIERSRHVQEPLYQSRRDIEKEVPFMLKGFCIEAFSVPHDSSENVGYYIQYGGQRFVLATDVGELTETVRRYLCLANHLVLEANYDVEMLRSGPYPERLKERVRCSTGHLSNSEAAEFLATSYTSELKNVWLCHLSGENNHPELAYKTIDIRLNKEGIRVGRDLSLCVLSRTTPTGVFVLE